VLGESQNSGTVNTARTVWRILSKSEKKWLILLLVLALLGAVLDTLSITLVIPAVSLLTDPNFKTEHKSFQPIFNLFGDPSPGSIVVIGMFLLVVVYILKNTYLGAVKYLQMRFQARVEVRLSNGLFDRYLHQPYSYHLTQNSSGLIRNLMDARAITDYAIAPVLLVFTETLILLGLAIVLLVVQPVGSIAVVSTMGLAGYFFHRFTRKFAGIWGQERQFHDGERLKEAQHGFGGIKDVKILGNEQHFLERYETHNNAKVSADQKFMFLQQLPILWLEVLVIFGLATLVSILVARGQSTTDLLPTLAVFAAAAFRVMPSAQRTLNSMQSLKYGHSILETISNDLLLSTSSSLKSPQQSSNSISQIELKNVSFGYEGIQRETIKNVSLTIGNGQSVGFIGASGAGKSTLIDLVLGLLEPTDGQILVNGGNISNDIRLWQRNIGYVPQSIFLTDDTLRSNIAFGLTKDKIDHHAVMTALAAAQLSDFVEELPDGLDTMVGERGIRLSGGQRQRIGIARALYHNPSLLVLDEATSSLDLETESGVMEAVEELHGQKTIIIVAHRLSTVSKCDNLALIENGELVAFGSVGEVMRIYRPQVEAPE